jgi:hypothetical protein
MILAFELIIDTKISNINDVMVMDVDKNRDETFLRDVRCTTTTCVYCIK